MAATPLTLPLSRSTVVVRAEGKVSAGLAEEAAILCPVRGLYFGLNPVGARIWDLLASPCTLAEICAAIQEEFEVTPERCTADVEQLLAELAQQGLIEEAPGRA